MGAHIRYLTSLEDDAQKKACVQDDVLHLEPETNGTKQRIEWTADAALLIRTRFSL